MMMRGSFGPSKIQEHFCFFLPVNFNGLLRVHILTCLCITINVKLIVFNRRASNPLLHYFLAITIDRLFKFDGDIEPNVNTYVICEQPSTVPARLTNTQLFKLVMEYCNNDKYTNEYGI